MIQELINILKDEKERKEFIVDGVVFTLTIASAFTIFIILDQILKGGG